MTKISAVFVDAPGSSVSYTVDWSDWLTTGDGISSSSWVVPSGLTTIATSRTSSSASIRISGGDACTSYEVENLINTSGGESTTRSFIVYYRNW